MKYIKIRIKGYLKNINENNINEIDTFGIKRNNIISFIDNDVKHKIIIKDNIITLLRENEEFINNIKFSKGKKYISEYCLKENNFTVELNIETIDLKFSDNLLLIKYVVIESNEIYEYKIELSDKYEYKKRNC